MPDKFANRPASMADPATKHFAITPGTEFTQPTRGVYVGADGDIVIQDMDGHSETYYGAKAGTIIPIRTRKVVSSTADPARLLGMF